MNTKYFGIWIEEDGGHYWILDANGGERDCGMVKPTDEQVTDYRNSIMKY